MKAISQLNEPELQGLVSIIIPAFNAGRYLAETLDSCLSQTDSNIEVIVVDDGSTDDTAGISAAYSIRDRRVISLHQSNSGQCSARNHALQTAKGEWVWFLDSDDLLFPWAVAELKALALRENAQMAIGQERGLFDNVIVEEYLKILSEGLSRNIKSDVFPTPWDANRNGGYSFNSVLCRTECIRAAGGFDEQLRAAEEFNLNCRLTARCDAIRVVKSENLSVVAKRFRTDSLAVTSRHQQSPPWALLSAAASFRVVSENSKDGLNAIRAEIRENIYASAIHAYRNGHQRQALENVSRIPAGQILRRVTPRWHAVLHVMLGFRTAERLLLAFRSLRDITTGTSTS